MKKATDRFIEGIELLDFTTGNSNDASLLFVTQLYQKARLSPKELFSLETAEIYEADAVYFRRFDDGRVPIPQIYIYDNTSGRYDTKKYAEIHRNLWSSCIIPVFIIIEKTQIKIFDSRNKVKIQGDDIITSPIETLQFSASAVKQFSAKSFDNGTFWELSQNQNKFLVSTSAYNDLIEGLKSIRKKFLENSKLPSVTAHKLLVLSILIKYLEERGDEGGSMFAKNFFKKFGAGNFCGVLRKKGKIVELFEQLSNHFNGKIFEWSDSNELEILKHTDLSILADYLDGNLKNNQYVFWRLYSFNHLPIELISSVYEEFLGKEKKDVVYTPHFLVNLSVDECMPISEPKASFKILDPSCGSGIFLVVAFKRLVEWNRYKVYLETGERKKLSSKELLRLLVNNIYGVDKEDDATRLTVFSLALALCDMLSPKEIWTDLKFEDLNIKNIHSKDFFTFLGEHEKKSFDLIIGNPPFDELTKTEFDGLVKANNINLNYKIPQNQIALLFLDQSIKLLKDGGLLSLIMPSGPLLYNDTIEFRRNFFSKNNVLQILDLTNLRRVLYGKADVSTAIIFVQAQLPDEKPIIHITVSKSRPAKEKILFELDHYDFHKVTKEQANESKFIWKANLLGGKRLYFLIHRLSILRSLGEYLKDKKKENWHVQEGFIIGSNSKKRKADFITGKSFLPTEAFTEEGIDESKIEIIKDKYFASPRIEEIYKPPLLLIKENIGEEKIPIYFSNRYLTYKDKIVGISTPKKNKPELEELHTALIKHNDLFRLFIASTSNQLFINKNTAILKQDLMRLPYPSVSTDLKLSFAENIIKDDVLKYGIEYLRINDNAITKKVATENDLTVFANVLAKALNSVYAEGEKHFQLSHIIESSGWYACGFKYAVKEVNYKYEKSEKAENDLSDLIESNLGKNIRVNRILRYYGKNTLYLIKPKQLRYWLKSIALRDADDSLQDLIKAGF
ncbi:MAG TPA: N-6 DNA methylase [Panacibacter sp.]|nr:N-6 DNA methylase [Panacibacter sp.]